MKNGFNQAAVVWSKIRRYQYLLNISEEQMSELLQVCMKTLKSYDQNPDAVTLKVVRIFSENTNVSLQSLITE